MRRGGEVGDDGALILQGRAQGPQAPRHDPVEHAVALYQLTAVGVGVALPGQRPAASDREVGRVHGEDVHAGGPVHGAVAAQGQGRDGTLILERRHDAGHLPRLQVELEEPGRARLRLVGVHAVAARAGPHVQLVLVVDDRQRPAVAQQAPQRRIRIADRVQRVGVDLVVRGVVDGQRPGAGLVLGGGSDGELVVVDRHDGVRPRLAGIRRDPHRLVILQRRPGGPHLVPDQLATGVDARDEPLAAVSEALDLTQRGLGQAVLRLVRLRVGGGAKEHRSGHVPGGVEVSAGD